ncbi:MAG: hypothetical protein Q7J84_04085 [Sulfuricaulis sp.]|nr:hypothetical protein [Sulfuricaulis sp.]
MRETTSETDGWDAMEDRYPAKIQAQMIHALRERARDGLLPYEGAWLPQQEVAVLQRARNRRSIARVLELFLLFLLMTAAGAALVALLWILCY